MLVWQKYISKSPLLKGLMAFLIVIFLVIWVWGAAGMIAFDKCKKQEKPAEKRITMCSISASMPIKASADATGIGFVYFYRGLAYSDVGNIEEVRKDFLEAVRWLDIAYEYRGRRGRKFVDRTLGEMIYLAELKNSETYNLWIESLHHLERAKRSER